MASNFYSPEHRPDPAHWTRTNVGFTSPLWWPFLMAASAGAAWFTYTNWSRLAATSWTGDLQRLGDGQGAFRAFEAAEKAGASLDERLSVQGEAAEEAGDPADDEVVSDAIDAAYAANLGPVPPPAAKARRSTGRKAESGGGSGKTSAGKKTAAKKTAGKAPAKKAVATNTAAKKSAAKKTGR